MYFSDVVLYLHIGAGFLSLSAAFVVMVLKKGDHRHRLLGLVFYYAMLCVFVTAIVLSVIVRPNLFLFLIALFSFFMAYRGRYYAVNRKGKIDRWYFFVACGALLCSVVMVCFGIVLLFLGVGNGVTLIVFAVVMGVFSVSDVLAYYGGKVEWKKRIGIHVGSMLAGTIATLTAFLVVNVPSDPEFIVWIAPTFVLTPVIIYYVNRVEKTGRV